MSRLHGDPGAERSPLQDLYHSIRLTLGGAWRAPSYNRKAPSTHPDAEHCPIRTLARLPPRRRPDCLIRGQQVWRNDPFQAACTQLFRRMTTNRSPRHPPSSPLTNSSSSLRTRPHPHLHLLPADAVHSPLAAITKPSTEVPSTSKEKLLTS